MNALSHSFESQRQPQMSATRRDPYLLSLPLSYHQPHYRTQYLAPPPIAPSLPTTPSPPPMSHPSTQQPYLAENSPAYSLPRPSVPIMSTSMHMTMVRQQQQPSGYRCDWQGEEECLKVFSRKSDMLRHKKIHSGQRDFVCNYNGCTKAFIQRSALKVHLRVHTGERPLACPVEGCDKRFADSSSLARHRKTHSGERTHPCTFPGCRKVFARRATLQKHEAVHMRGYGDWVESVDERASQVDLYSSASPDYSQSESQSSYSPSLHSPGLPLGSAAPQSIPRSQYVSPSSNSGPSHPSHYAYEHQYSVPSHQSMVQRDLARYTTGLWDSQAAT